MNKRAFAIGCHPDDIEFVMAGTLILLRQAGYEIHYMNVANGSCGTTQYDEPTIIKMRREEALNAATHIGAVFHESLVNDLDVFFVPGLIKRVSAVIREVAPEIILTQSPSDYMEDHQNTCRVVVSAAFYRGMINHHSIPDRPVTEQDVTIYHAMPAGLRDPLRNPVTPDLYVDTTSVLDTQTEMLAMHKSQKEWLDTSQGMDSYLITMQDRSREVGRMSGAYEHAEGWRRRLYLGYCAEDADPLKDALENVVVPE